MTDLELRYGIAAPRSAPLPAWTTAYPERDRRVLAGAGYDPGVWPRGREFNLRIIEARLVLERVRRLFHGKWLQPRQIWRRAVAMVERLVGIGHPIRSFEDGGAPPPARPPEQVEVPADWLSAYPVERAALLAEWGVPTVPGSPADRFNRRLVQLAPVGRDDPAELERAAGRALFRVFLLDEGDAGTPCEAAA